MTDFNQSSKLNLLMGFFAGFGPQVIKCVFFHVSQSRCQTGLKMGHA